MLAESNSQCSLCRLPHTHPFADLSPAALADYNAIGSLSTYPASETLFREQQQANRVIVLHRGHARLSCTSKDGRSMTLRIAAPGHILGLSAALSGAPYEVSAKSIDTVSVKIIRRDAFIHFIEAYPMASLQIARALAAEYQSAFEDVRRLGLSTSVPSRLASLLMAWRTAPLIGQPEARFQMVHTHDEIAAFVATTRESVTRTLTKFRADKYIHVQGVWIEVLEPEKMARLAV